MKGGTYNFRDENGVLINQKCIVEGCSGVRESYPPTFSSSSARTRARTIPVCKAHRKALPGYIRVRAEQALLTGNSQERNHVNRLIRNAISKPKED